MARADLSAAITLAALWVSGVAQAQVLPICGTSGNPLDRPVVMPANAARSAARNTLIQVDIDPDYDPTFGLYRAVDGTVVDVPIAATWQRVGDSPRFVIRPDQLLEANTTYRIQVVPMEPGVVEDFTFTTSAVIDSAPPVFDFNDGTVSDVTSATCADDAGLRRVSLTFKHGTDDGGAGSLEYLLYLTRASGVDGPQLVARQYRPSGEQMVFVVDAEILAAPLCVTVDAIDGAGRRTAGGGEMCFDPLQGDFFEPCSVGGAGHHGDRASTALLILLVAVGLGVRARRLRGGT